MSERPLSQRQVDLYTLGNVLPGKDRMSIRSEKKLVFLQMTPIKAVKSRKVGNTEIPYVSIDYVERCLNFVSNFNRGIEIVDKGFYEYTRKNKNNEDKKVYEARVQARCYIYMGENRIERTCFGSRISHENPAVSKFAVYESAKSMATKSFADTFGIGSDKIGDENNAIKIARQEVQDFSIGEIVDGFEKAN